MSVEKVRRFGTFEGVFLTILSIFGVILFLRTGWAVGNAGLFNVLLILVVSEFISLTTALSLSAVSTNIEGGNIELMLLLTYILKLNDEWKSAEPRVLKVLSRGEDKEKVGDEISEKLYRARFEAKIEIIDPREGSIRDLIESYSSKTDLVILGLPVPSPGTEEIVASRIRNLLSPLGTALLVRSVTQKEFFLEEG